MTTQGHDIAHGLVLHTGFGETSGLAEAYGVTTKVLNQAVRRNAERFPPDFMFRLTPASPDQWRGAVRLAHKCLGLKDSRLARRVATIFVDLKHGNGQPSGVAEALPRSW